MLATPANGARWLLIGASGKARVSVYGLLINDAPRSETAPTLCRVNQPA